MNLLRIAFCLARAIRIRRSNESIVLYPKSGRETHMHVPQSRSTLDENEDRLRVPLNQISHFPQCCFELRVDSDSRLRPIPNCHCHAESFGRCLFHHPATTRHGPRRIRKRPDIRALYIATDSGGYSIDYPGSWHAGEHHLSHASSADDTFRRQNLRPRSYIYYR